MSEQIEAPNYTQIPNIILDEWIRKLTGSQSKVVIEIARKTFGWHKPEDRISRSQLMEITGMTKNTVSAACEFLIENGYIYSKGTNQAGTLYGLIVTQSSGVKIDPPKIGLPNIDPQGIPIIDPLGGQNLTIQNIVKKSRLKKDSVSSRSRSDSATSGIIELLIASGIGEPTRSRIASLDHMSEDYARAHCNKAKAEALDVRLLITRLKNNDPIPEPTHAKYTGGKYADLINRID